MLRVLSSGHGFVPSELFVRYLGCKSTWRRSVCGASYVPLFISHDILIQDGQKLGMYSRMQLGFLTAAIGATRGGCSAALCHPSHVSLHNAPPRHFLDAAGGGEE